MARLLRLALFLLVTAVWSSSALALVPKGTQYAYDNGLGPWFDTANAACDARAALRNTQNAPNVYTRSGQAVEGTSGCRLNFTYPGGSSVIVDAIYSRGGVCPSNSVVSGSACQCATGYEENSTHTLCVPKKSELEDFCAQGAAGKFTWNQSGTIGKNSPLPAASCYKPEPPFPGPDLFRGCKTTIGDVMAVPKDGDPLLKNWSGSGVMTGETCDDEAATDVAPKAADDPCPNGFPGTVNGVTKCIAAEPDKGVEGVKGTSQTNADGTKIDTTETTKCSGSTCTTTTNTTTTPPGGGSSSSSTSSRTESLAEKCEKDKKNPVCKKTQGGEGSATSEMTCDTNSSAEGCGGEGAAVGSLYTKKDATVAQALTKAKDALQASPLGSSVSGFFNVSAGGTCPHTSANIPFLNKTVVIDTWCTTFAANMFGIVKAVLLMLATWMAFRIAIDN